MGKIDCFLLTCFFSTSCNPKNGKLLVLVLTCFFSNSWSPENEENWLVLVLTCFFSQIFGIDMFFSQIFGVDMFFSISCKSKNGERWLVLVLTDWNLEPSAYTRIEGKIWKCKITPKNNVFFQKDLNRHASIHIHIYIFLNSWNPKNGKNTSFGVDMFFSNSWSPKNGKTY